MKTILSLLAVACVALVAVGCDPAPKNEPAAAPNAKSAAPAPPATK